MRIRDSVAFVTGANRGLGLAFVHELLAAGAKKQVQTLLENCGYSVIDLGNLRDGGLMQQAGGPLAGRDFLERGES